MQGLDARAGLFAAVLVTFCTSCDLDYPEVVIVNKVAPDVAIRDPSFSGCRWNVTLGYEDHTGPRRCLPGEGKVHFQKLDLGKYAAEVASGEAGEPTWYNYQTINTWTVGIGDFLVIEVHEDDMEQDFSIPGPFGH